MKKLTSKVIIFDFDGTLVDTFPKSFEILNELSQEYGYSKVHLTNTKELRELTTKQFLDLFDIPIYKIPFVLRRVQKVLNDHITRLEPIADIEKTIQALKNKGFILGLISSNIQKNIVDFINQYPKLDVFSFIYPNVIPYTKSFILNKVIKKHQLPASDFVYIGDESRDIRAAHKSKMPVIAVEWGFSTAEVLREYHPEYLVSSAKEILDIFS